MATIFYLCPGDRETYLHMLDCVSPVLDREGISFHIARPGEDIPSTILRESKEVKE